MSMKLSKKLKKIFSSTPEITSKTTIDHAIQKLVVFICSILDCERATVYNLDKKTNELWSKAATGSKKTFKI